MLTPLEIENKRFSKQMMNGYSVGEVDDFLDELTLDYEKLFKENAEIKAKLEEALNNLTQYRSIESTLQNTLVMAQSTAEDIKNVAKQQADQIVKDAEVDARKAVNDLNQEITEAYPSLPVEITGLNDTPSPGDKFMAFDTEKKARSIGEQRKTQARLKENKGSEAVSLDDLFSKISEGLKEINVIIKERI